MDPEKQRAISRKGGQSVHPSKRSFSRDPDYAAEMGRRGGYATNEGKRKSCEKVDPEVVGRFKEWL